MLRNTIKNNIKIFINPSGKVHSQYNKFILWSSISNTIGSIQGVLSTHSMLSVVGNASNELTISINYIGKDIAGQLGGLWYINKIGKRVDTQSKQITNINLGINEISILLECLTPFLPIYTFIPIAGLANVGKNISFTGLGAINAKIIQKLAKDNNIGEIYSKITMINTLGSSIGMGIGLALSGLIPDHSTRLCLMPILSILRIYTYKKSIKYLL